MHTHIGDVLVSLAMRRPSLLVMLVVTLCVGCRASPDARRELIKALQSAQDVVEVEKWITEADIGSCAVLQRVLVALDGAKLAERYGARAYRAFVEQTLARGRSQCDMSSHVFKEDTLKGSSALLLAATLNHNDAAFALALLGSAREPALLRRKAELLLELGEPDASREALIESLEEDEDVEVRARAARLALGAGHAKLAWELSKGRQEAALLLESSAALAVLGHREELSQNIRSAPLHLRAEVAVYALRRASAVSDLVSLEGAAAELLVAAAQMEHANFEDGGVAVLKRAAALLPQDAEVQQLLARALEAQGRVDEAIASWDRAADLAPALEAATLVPIRLLREGGHEDQARQRADALAERARVESSWTAERMASLAYKYAGDPGRAIVGARAALETRPDDGRLRSELALRLEEAGERSQAGRILIELLVCGTHGRPWHRHEIAARISALLGAADLRRELATLSCTAVDEADLNEHLSRLAEGPEAVHSSDSSGE